MVLYPKHSVNDFDVITWPASNYFYDDIFEELWLPVGDNKMADIKSLIQQNRLHKD